MKATEDDKPSFRSSWRDLLGFSARLDGSDATGQPSILSNEESVLIFFYPERLNTRAQSRRGPGDLNGRRADAHWTRDDVAVLPFLRMLRGRAVSKEPTKDEILVDGSQESWVLIKIQVTFGDPICTSFYLSLCFDPPMRNDSAGH